MYTDVSVGQWVSFKQGKASFTGYIVNIFENSDYIIGITIKIIKSENSRFKGIQKFRIKHTKNTWLFHPIYETDSLEALNDLIDFTLLINDKEWFNELVERKNNILESKEIRESGA